MKIVLNKLINGTNSLVSNSRVDYDRDIIIHVDFASSLRRHVVRLSKDTTFVSFRDEWGESVVRYNRRFSDDETLVDDSGFSSINVYFYALWDAMPTKLTIVKDPNRNKLLAKRVETLNDPIPKSLLPDEVGYELEGIAVLDEKMLLPLILTSLGINNPEDTASKLLSIGNGVQEVPTPHDGVFIRTRRHRFASFRKV